MIIAKRPRRYTGWPQCAHLPAPAVRVYCAWPSRSTAHSPWLAADRVQDLSEAAWRKSANCRAGRSNGSTGLGGHSDLSRASQQQRCEAQRAGRLLTTRLEPNTAGVTGPQNSEPEAQRGPAVLSTHACRGHETCLVSKHAGCHVFFFCGRVPFSPQEAKRGRRLGLRPTKIKKSHLFVPFTPTIIKMRKIGAL